MAPDCRLCGCNSRGLAAATIWSAAPAPPAPRRNADVLAAGDGQDVGAAERARRAHAINFGRGSVRYEGGILIGEAEAINARFVAGELTEAEWIAAVIASDTARHRE